VVWITVFSKPLRFILNGKNKIENMSTLSFIITAWQIALKIND
jgi:hypothetical protein